MAVIRRELTHLKATTTTTASVASDMQTSISDMSTAAATKGSMVTTSTGLQLSTYSHIPAPGGSASTGLQASGYSDDNAIATGSASTGLQVSGFSDEGTATNTSGPATRGPGSNATSRQLMAVSNNNNNAVSLVEEVDRAQLLGVGDKYGSGTSGSEIIPSDVATAGDEESYCSSSSEDNDGDDEVSYIMYY